MLMLADMSVSEMLNDALEKLDHLDKPHCVQNVRSYLEELARRAATTSCAADANRAPGLN